MISVFRHCFIPLAVFLLVSVHSTLADETLSRRIDGIVQKGLEKAKLSASPRSDDVDFLRRVYLDITGRIPTMAQAVAFLDDSNPGKRAKLIDELLSRPEYGFYFALRWNELIVDRTADKRLTRAFNSPAFHDWLTAQFNKGTGWDEIVRAMLTAEGDFKTNPAGTFIMSNRVNGFPRPEDIASMTGRLFMGLNVRCAQCHDHPSVDQWLQKDFWGMAAFFGQVRDHSLQLNTGDENRNPKWAETPNPDAKIEKGYMSRLRSVGQIPPQVGPRIAIPRGNDPTAISSIVDAKFFLSATPALPDTGPYRPKFAAWLTSKENPYFARASVNRLWAHFFARGLVNPIDDMTPQNAPSHPELLDLLEREFKASGFNTKQMVRAICNSETYQRSSRPTKENREDQEWYSHMPMRVLNPHQLLDSYSLALSRTVPILFGNRDAWTANFMPQDADEPATNLTQGIPQFLQMMNGNLGSGFTLPKAIGGKKRDEAINILYLTALSRRPRAEELERMLAHVERRAKMKGVANDRGYMDVYWVLLNSAEFAFNR